VFAERFSAAQLIHRPAGGSGHRFGRPDAAPWPRRAGRGNDFLGGIGSKVMKRSHVRERGPSRRGPVLFLLLSWLITAASFATAAADQDASLPALRTVVVPDALL